MFLSDVMIAERTALFLFSYRKVFIYTENKGLTHKLYRTVLFGSVAAALEL